MPHARQPDLRASPERRMRRLAAPLLCGTLLALAGSALAQSWVNPGNGSWYDAVNWSPAFVPVAGSNVTVSNGGVALLDTVASGGATATPQLNSLTVGLLGTGTGRGGVSSTGVELLAGFLTVGSSVGAAGSFAEGRVATTGANVSATGTRIGVLFSAAAAASVNGAVVVDGQYQAGGGPFEMAQMFQAAAGSSAEGRLHASNLAGTVGGSFWIVGNISANDASQVGSRSFGEIVATGGGTLALASFSTTYIGTTLGSDRVSDASGTRINEATGVVRLGGTLDVQQNGQALLVGRTGGGRADGTLEVGALAMGANRFGSLEIGTSGAQGQASGRLVAGSGDLQHIGNLFVGTSSGGSAQGEVQLGGALLGNGTGTANVGTASGSAGQLVQTSGTVVAAGGFSGYNNLFVGTLTGDLAAGSQAVGRLTGGADAGAAATGSVLVGRMAGNGNGAALADGELRSAGSLGMNGGTLEVAQMFLSAAGSSARGVVELGGDVGRVGGSFLIVANLSANDASQVGSQSFGELVAGGGMTLASFSTTFIGTTLGVDRSSDVSGTRINEATGVVRLGGTLDVQQNGQALLVGRTGGGRADGTLEVGTLAMGVNRFGSLEIGTSGVQGQASGRLVAGSGDLQHIGNLFVGTSSGGSAQGEVQLGGALLGNGTGTASVGTASGSAGQLVQASGTVVAAGGFSGYSNLFVGTLTGDLAAGSQAIGRLVGGADAGAATTGSVLVGRMAGNGNGAALADGELRSAGSLGMSGGGLEVAQMFGSAGGSSARGVVELGGNVGTVGGSFLIVGNISANDASQLGNQSFGELVAGGGMTLASFGTTFIGTTLGSDRVSDASGKRINEATGVVRLGGTLDVQQNGQGMMVGRTGAGHADGTLELARVEMGANSFGLFEVGTAIDGDATGRLAVGGGTLRAASLWVGRVFGAGTASGEVALTGTSLQTGSVVAGAGGGTADIALADSAAAIADDFVLGRGRLALERSLVAVGNEFRLGADATLALMIEDEARGSGYGAVDALTAFLDGELQLDLTSYVFGSGTGIFDLVRAGVAGSIAGDFVSVVFSGLAVGWQAFTGVELVNGQEIYRLRLSTVPEPGGVALVLLALGLMVAAARQRRLRAARGATGRS